RLAALGVSSGPCGAAALAGLRAALTGTGREDRRTALGLDAASVVVLLSTEGRAANPHATAGRPDPATGRPGLSTGRPRPSSAD
ncbi:hypothetical protein ACWDZX_38825, partial [Streptomyces collinus]